MTRKQPTGFHITASGRPGACYAGEGNCPLKANTKHFSTMQEARDYSEKKLAQDNNVLASAKKSPQPQSSKSAPSPSVMPSRKSVNTASSARQKPYNQRTRQDNRHRSNGYKSHDGNKRNSNNRQGSQGGNQQRKYFAVVGKLDNMRDFSSAQKTTHQSQHRTRRQRAIMENCGQGKPIAQFVVDKQHPNGNEIHQVNDNGVINVYNENTGRHITDLVARPTQVKRCYSGVGEKVPESLMLKAVSNTAKGFNHL